MKITPEKQHSQGNISVQFEVKNTGSREGDEVVQLYMNQLVSTVTVYEKVLRGFERVNLKSGETKTISFTLTPDDLSIWNRDMHFVVEPGVFKVMIGASSEDIKLDGKFEIINSK